MDVNQKWTIQMKNSISGGGIMLPQVDPFDASVFYVSDGLFSTYSGMRFRKLSIETGEEAANILTKDGVRCIYCNKEYVYTFLNKRILKLHRSDLTIARTYKEKIPRYTGYVDSDGSDVFLLANWNASSLSVFDLQSQHIHRKKIDGCCGIFRTESDNFLIFNYNSILEYSLKSNKLNKIADTEKYTKCVRGKSGRTYLLCVNYSPTISGLDDYKIMVYSFVPEPRIEKIISIPAEICSHLYRDVNFRLSEDEKWLYLFDDKSIWIYSIFEDKILFQHTFQFELILNIFTEKSLVIISCNLQKGNKVTALEIKI